MSAKLSPKLRLRLEVMALLPEPILIERLRRLSRADLLAFYRQHGICNCSRKQRKPPRHEPGRGKEGGPATGRKFYHLGALSCTRKRHSSFGDDDPADSNLTFRPIGQHTLGDDSRNLGEILSEQARASIHEADKLTGKELLARVLADDPPPLVPRLYDPDRKKKAKRKSGNKPARIERLPCTCRCGAARRAIQLPPAVQAVLFALLWPADYSEPPAPEEPTPSVTSEQKSYDMAARHTAGRGLFHHEDFLQGDTFDAYQCLTLLTGTRSLNGYDRREDWRLQVLPFRPAG